MYACYSNSWHCRSYLSFLPWKFYSPVELTCDPWIEMPSGDYFCRCVRCFTILSPSLWNNVRSAMQASAHAVRKLTEAIFVSRHNRASTTVLWQDSSDFRLSVTVSHQNKMQWDCGRRQTSLQCRHLANCTKHIRGLWYWHIRSITWKHDVIHKTGST